MFKMLNCENEVHYWWISRDHVSSTELKPFVVLETISRQHLFYTVDVVAVIKSVTRSLPVDPHLFSVWWMNVNLLLKWIKNTFTTCKCGKQFYLFITVFKETPWETETKRVGQDGSSYRVQQRETACFVSFTACAATGSGWWLLILDIRWCTWRYCSAHPRTSLLWTLPENEKETNVCVFIEREEKTNFPKCLKILGRPGHSLSQKLDLFLSLGLKQTSGWKVKCIQGQKTIPAAWTTTEQQFIWYLLHLN